MRQWTKVGLVACLMVFSTIPIATNSGAVDPLFINGTVSDDNGPLEGILVTIEDLDEEYSWEVETDEDGQFSRDISGTAQLGHIIDVHCEPTASKMFCSYVRFGIDQTDLLAQEVIVNFYALNTLSSNYDDVDLGYVHLWNFNDADDSQLTMTTYSVDASSSYGLQFLVDWGWGIGDLVENDPHVSTVGEYTFLHDKEYKGVVELYMQVHQVYHYPTNENDLGETPLELNTNVGTYVYQQLPGEFNSEDSDSHFDPTLFAWVDRNDMQGGLLSTEYVYHHDLQTYLKFYVYVYWRYTLYKNVGTEEAPNWQWADSYWFWYPDGEEEGNDGTWRSRTVEYNTSPF